jgi:hypothetical protein
MSNHQDKTLVYPRASRMPTTYRHGDPYFSKIQERRQKVSLLVSIWIFISGLYTRAQMFQDSRDAVGEALKLVETFEAKVSIESSTAKALADKGWGGGKSVEELWADAFAAVSTPLAWHITTTSTDTYKQREELLATQSLKHETRVDFERALQHFPDHPEAIVGLSNILLDIYSEAITLEPTSPSAISSASQPPSASSFPTAKTASTKSTSRRTPRRRRTSSRPPNSIVLRRATARLGCFLR